MAALAAMILHALLPAGWMPARGGQLVICTGQGAAVAADRFSALDPGDASKSPPQSKQDHPCAFAGHSAGAVPALPGDSAGKLAWIPFADALPVTRLIAPGRGLAAPPPPSHAPPLTV